MKYRGKNTENNKGIKIKNINTLPLKTNKNLLEI